MAGQSFKLTTKMEGNFIEIYYVVSTGYIRKIAIVEVPCDSQWRDNVDLVDEICNAIRKRIKKSI